jgi:hypothetical protein
MKTAKEILDQLRQTTEHSQPNIKYQETMNLINELDELLNSVSLAEDTESETLDGYEYLLEYDDSTIEDSISTQDLSTILNELDLNSVENVEEKITEDVIMEQTPPPKRGRTKK